MRSLRWITLLLAALAGCSPFAADEGTSAADAGGDASVATSDAGTDAGIDAPIEAGPPSVSAYAAVVEADNPLVYYRLSDATGDAVNLATSANVAPLVYGESVQRHAPGLLTNDNDGAVVITGSGGVGQFLEAAQSTVLSTPSSELSLECWFRSTSLSTATTDFGYLLSYDNGGPSKEFQAYVLQVHDNTLNFYLAKIGTLEATAMPLKIDTTYHVVATYSQNATILYVNGVVAAASQNLGVITYSHTSGLGVGGDVSSNGSVFDGTIDEIAIYDHALTLKRVVAHYNAGTGK